jgi:uncharacterized protein with FMN-binding domain
MRKKLLTSCAAVATLALQGSTFWASANAAAPKKPAPPKKKVMTVTKTVTGTTVKCDRWGFMQLALTIKQTVTVVGTKKTVTAVKITGIAEPTYPTHTDRSIYINKQALPLLNGEVQQLQLNALKLETIAGATDSTVSFVKSLQAALLAAKQA